MDRDWLYQKYVVERLSARQVAEEAGCTFPTIIRYLEKNNISQHIKFIKYNSHPPLKGKVSV